MELSVYNNRDLQTMAGLLTLALRDGLDLQVVTAAVNAELGTRMKSLPITPPKPAKQSQPDNVTVCPVCGKPAIILALSRTDRTPTATHAIQCQNRPATDQPWSEGMCGHTEYIVRGNK